MISEQQIGKNVEGRSLKLIWKLHRQLPSKTQNKYDISCK